MVKIKTPQLQQTSQICLDPCALSGERRSGTLRERYKNLLIHARSDAQTLILICFSENKKVEACEGAPVKALAKEKGHAATA